MMRMISVFLLGLIGLLVLESPGSCEGRHSREAKKAIHRAWHEAFDQGADSQLRSLYPEMTWKKPSRWKWSVVKEEQDQILLKLTVNGRSRPWRSHAKSLWGWFLYRYPKLVTIGRPVRPFQNRYPPGRWTATRGYVVVGESVRSVEGWSAKPVEKAGGP